MVVPGEPGADVDVPGGPGADMVVPRGPGADVVVPGGPGADMVVPGEPGADVVVSWGPEPDVVVPGGPGADVVVPGGPGADVVVPGGPGAVVGGPLFILLCWFLTLSQGARLLFFFGGSAREGERVEKLNLKEPDWKKIEVLEVGGSSFTKARHRSMKL